jgi:hypothetical protein
MTISGGNFEAGTIVKTGGTSSQFLKADGSVDSSTYVTTDTTQSISGVKTFSTGSLILAAAGTANSTHLRNSAGDSTSVSGSNALGFNQSNKIYVTTVSKGGFILGFNNSVSNREYTLQDGSGTLAFTTDISTAVAGYLPLAGGTLTGALNGTSGAFTGAVSGSAVTITATTGIAGDFTNNSSTNETLRARNNGSGNIAAFRNASAEVASITNSGGLTLSGALNGTSASFSDTITSTKNVDTILSATNGGTNRLFTLLSNTSGYLLTGIEGSTAGSLVTNSTAYAGVITTNATSDLVLGTNFTRRLIIDKSTGAATFSSSVKVNGTPIATSGILSVVTSTSSIGATADLGLLITNDGTNGKMSQIGFGYSESKTGAVIGGIITSGSGSTSSALFFGTRDTTDGTTAPTERMRITSGGYVKASTNGSTAISLTGTYHEFVQNSVGSANTYFYSTGSTQTGANIIPVSDRSNSSAFDFLTALSSGGGDTEFKLRGDGNAYADGSWTGGGADYAEYFEWSDGNVDNEDRRGYSVSLINDKIKIAEEGDLIIGVISGNASVIGDSAWNMWNEKYLRDDFQTYIRDENGDRILNPNFDPDSEYIPREKRPEWGVVGLVGKLCIIKGQPTMPNWIKLKNISDTVEQWLIK